MTTINIQNEDSMVLLVCKHALGFLDIFSILELFGRELWKRSKYSEVPLNLRTKESDWILRLKVLIFWFAILNMVWRIIVYYSTIFIAFVLFSPEYNWSENYHKNMRINYIIGFCINNAAAYDVQKHFTGNMAPAKIHFVSYLIMDLLKCNYHKHDFHISASEWKKISKKCSWYWIQCWLESSNNKTLQCISICNSMIFALLRSKLRQYYYFGNFEWLWRSTLMTHIEPKIKIQMNFNH